VAAKADKDARGLWLVVICAILLGSLMFGLITRRPQVAIGDHVFKVEIASTNTQRRLGLGGRDSLANDSGMLFVFDQNFYHSFWMKDMRFNLDIIWINEDMEIVHIERNLSPDTYPQSFTSTLPARYVLELNGGSYLKYSIHLGQTVKFKNI